VRQLEVNCSAGTILLWELVMRRSAITAKDAMRQGDDSQSGEGPNHVRRRFWLQLLVALCAVLAVTRIEIPPRTRWSRHTRLARTGPLALCLLGCWLQVAGRPAPRLEVFPKHFLLHPGEQIHYTVCESREGNQPRCPDAEFATQDPEIVRLIKPTGLFEALRPGRTELVVRTPTSERRVTIQVAGRAETPMMAVPHSTVREIVAKELLFVGHANLDGFDHTAVAKPGIDRLVQEAKKNGWTVVYWVSQEYPDWYTADRHPDYAIISEGQEHQIRVEAQRIVFAGGGFMFCFVRNAQMTLHSMLKHNVAPRIHFVFPAQAIWRGPADARPYPAPMALLTTSFARCANDARAYDEVVVPFLDRMIMQFPVAGYPADPPAPPLSDLLKDWNIVVRFGDRFERVYRRGDSNKTLLVEFQGV